MEENVLFQPGQNQKTTLQPSSSLKPSPLPSPPPPPPPSSQIPLEEESSFFDIISSHLGIIIKIIGGIFILLLVFVIAFKFIFPLFGNSKKENVTLTYWGLWEDKSVMETVIKEFEKENPNIKIEYLRQDPKQYRDRLITRSNLGAGPDIFRFHNTWLLQLADFLLPLPESVMQKEQFQKAYYPVIQKDLIRNGAIYGIPLQIDTLSLFVNTEILQDSGAIVPTTWEEFSTTARILTVKEESGKIKTAGAAMGTFDNINHAPDIISLLFAQNGVDLYRFSEDPQNASDALDFYTSFSKGDANVWDETLDSSLLSFAKGNLAMYFGYSWDIFTIKAINPELVFQTVSVPSLPQRPLTIASYWVEGVSSKSKHPKESFLFLAFLAKKETGQKLFTQESKTRLFGELYPQKDLADSLKNNTLVYPFVLQAPNAVSSFFVDGTYDNGLNSQMNGYLGNAVRSILTNTSSQTAIETLSQGVSQILKQYGK